MQTKKQDEKKGDDDDDEKKQTKTENTRNIIGGREKEIQSNVKKFIIIAATKQYSASGMVAEATRLKALCKNNNIKTLA